MAAPAFGSAGTQLQGSGSTMNVDVPDSVAAGDIVVVTAFVDTSTVTVTGLATDFAQAPDSPVFCDTGGSGGAHRLYVMWKRATAADSTAGTYDFTLSGSTYRNAQAIRYTGAVGSGDPWDVTNSAQSGANNDTVSPAVSDTTTVADTLLVWAATNWSGGTWTPPTDFTERRDTGDGVCTVADKSQAAAGSTGAITGTCTSSDRRTAWLGALKPSTASSTGEVFPGSGSSVSETPWSDDTWNTPGNVTADDAATANVIAPSFDSPDQTFVLKSQGFYFSGIPDGATINGVTARVNAWFRSGQGSGSLDLCQLLDTSGAKVGTNQCATPVALTTTTSTVITKGGAADLWGNALDSAWVKDPDFGIALGCLATAANADVDIDYVTLEITYTVAAGNDYTETPTDNEGLTDSQALDQAKGSTDSEALTDLTDRQAEYQRASTDTAALTDSVTVAIERAATDTASLTDTASTVLGREVTATDPANLTDTVTTETSKAVAPTDPLGLTDTAETQGVFARDVTDPAALTDSITITGDRAVAPIDTAALTDAAATTASYARSPADVANLTDSVTADVGKLLDATDPLGLTDSRILDRGLGPAEVAALTDNVIFELTLVLADAAILTDAAEIVAAYERILTDDLALTDIAGSDAGLTYQISAGGVPSRHSATAVAVRHTAEPAAGRYQVE